MPFLSKMIVDWEGRSYDRARGGRRGQDARHGVTGWMTAHWRSPVRDVLLSVIRPEDRPRREPALGARKLLDAGDPHGRGAEVSRITLPASPSPYRLDVPKDVIKARQLARELIKETTAHCWGPVRGAHTAPMDAVAEAL
ncbi:hypothetical protein CTA1_5859 [Colletotrichum tanaceti]|uniref:Uncharacterized protein n=1 Tax=Colletotrichum tanaceti TaxID=1306861 RepID=A0A4U6X473_9PEZI|nr:hypothetical protein CTA1_5859 [Colletotrichum tanaceti]